MNQHRIFLGLMRPAIFATVIVAATTVCDAQGKGGSNGGSTAPSYSIIPFAPDDVQFDGSGVFGLSDSGDVVGVVNTANGQASYHLDLDTGTYTALPGRVWSVNNSGECAGTLPAVSNAREGYYLSGLGAEPVALPPLTGDAWVDVYRINDSRVIVGRSSNLIDGSTAVVWRPILNKDGTVTVDGPCPLLPLEGETFSVAVDLSQPVAGGPFEILGRSGPVQAVVWTIDLNPDGTLTLPSDPLSLGGLDGLALKGYAINSLGNSCGSSGAVPFFKPFDGGAQPLKVVRNTSFGRAMDINTGGQIVGQIETLTKSNSYHQGAYLWEGVDADPVDLENFIDRKSGWELSYANYLNSRGDIAGSGYRNGVPNGLGFIMILKR